MASQLVEFKHPVSGRKVIGKFSSYMSINIPVGIGRRLSSSALAMKAIRSCSSNMEGVFRPLGNFHSDIWAGYFTSLPLNEAKFKSDSIQTELLKEEVKQMLIMTTTNPDPLEKINLIDTLCRLGVSYHFENEIEQQLHQIFYTQPKVLEEENDYDLCSVALIFRVFRQFGYKISCDVFNKFMDGENKFKESLVGDLKGMLSLYEAAHLIIPGENILEEALAFTKTHLESHASQGSCNLCMNLNNVLRQPLHTGVPRVEARKYIDLYENDECRNETLYKFAKYDYCRVQFLHLRELKDILEWWKEMNLAKEYSYSRDRVVESYFWLLALHFEPHYASARMLSIKFMLLTTIIDDTYDSYGSYEELLSFTDAIERWDYDALDQLPGYMKKLYKAILDVFCEYENDENVKGRPYSIDQAREEVKRIVRAYQTQGNWLKQGYVRPMDEYLRNEVITGAVYIMLAHSFMGMPEIAGIKEFKWLASDPKICRAASSIARLENDIAGHEAEQRRGRHPPSSIQCYMKQYGVPKEKAIQGLQKMVEDAWKDINEQCMRRSAADVVPRAILALLVNYARLIRTLYTYGGDGNTNQIYMKQFITKILVEHFLD